MSTTCQTAESWTVARRIFGLNDQNNAKIEGVALLQGARLYCFSHFVGNKRVQRSARVARLFCLVSIFWVFSTLFFYETDSHAAVEFETFDESDVANESSEQNADELNAMPEIEAEQHDLRLERRNASGISLGEVMPLVSLAIEYQRHLTDSRSIFVTAGTGSLTSTAQYAGEAATSNKMNARVIEVGHMWWTSKSFPIALSAFVTGLSGDAVAIGTDASRGRYNVTALGAGGDFKMETLFENGFWLKWSLISLRYLKPVSESHKNVALKNLSSMRTRFYGLKLVGITNLTVGYAW